MKKLFLITGIFLLSGILYSQDAPEIKTRWVSLTPLSERVQEVNGLAVGLGGSLADRNTQRTQTINGLNLDVNPVGLLIWMFFDPAKEKNEHTFLTVNGITLSGAGYGRNVDQNGLSVSVYNYGRKVNGFLVSGLSTSIDKGNGIVISGLMNGVDDMRGVSISVFNGSEKMKGLQLGLINKAEEMRGVQVGVVNSSKKMKGLQIGIWNKNAKRSLPIINF